MSVGVDSDFTSVHIFTLMTQMTSLLSNLMSQLSSSWLFLSSSKHLRVCEGKDVSQIKRGEEREKEREREGERKRRREE